jgi:hypothetical protein
MDGLHGRRYGRIDLPRHQGWNDKDQDTDHKQRAASNQPRGLPPGRADRMNSAIERD